MLVVIADVQGEEIQRAVIAERLLFGIERVVLLNPASAEGMQSKCEEDRCSKIKQAVPAEKQDNDDVESNGCDNTKNCPSVHDRYRTKPGRPRDL